MLPASDEPAPGGPVAPPGTVPAERRPAAVGQRLDTYLAAVAQELHTSGVLTGAPQRSDPAERLMGSIVLDCTALRLEAWTPGDGTGADARSLGDALHPERPAPVVATWDEYTGWCVGLHHDSTRSSQRYLRPGALFPDPAAVAGFVVGLALGHTIGTAVPGRARPLDP